MGWPGLGVLTRSDINQAVLPQKWFQYNVFFCLFFFLFFFLNVFFFFFFCFFFVFFFLFLNGGFYVVKVVHYADQL